MSAALDLMLAQADKRTLEDALNLADAFLDGYVSATADENGVTDFVIDYTEAFNSAVDAIQSDPMFAIGLLYRLCEMHCIAKVRGSLEDADIDRILTLLEQSAIQYPSGGNALRERIAEILVPLLKTRPAGTVWTSVATLPERDGAHVFVLTPDNPAAPTWPAIWNAEVQNFNAGGGWFELDEVRGWMYAPIPGPKLLSKSSPV